MSKLAAISALCLILASCTGATGSPETSTIIPTSTSPSPTPSSTTAASTTSSAPTVPSTIPDPGPDRPVVEGWAWVEASPRLFGSVTINDSIVLGDRLIVVGCDDQLRATNFSAWFSDDGATWTRATGPTPDRSGLGVCLQSVISTPHGLYTSHSFNLYRSVDGADWQAVELPSPVNEFPGNVRNMFVSGDRLTVLLTTASEGETTVARLVTTTDGVRWNDGPDAGTFDSSAVTEVIAGGDGLLAVGASPAGEFVPTAAVWTSPDGQTWRKLTPEIDDGLEVARMTDVAELRGGYVAVGGDPGGSDLMASWTSANGVRWHRSPPPIGDIAPEFGWSQADTVTTVGGRLVASGFEFDASRGSQRVPVMWESFDGIEWRRIDEVEATPFHIQEFNGELIGFWPPAHWVDEPVQVLRAVG